MIVYCVGVRVRRVCVCICVCVRMRVRCVSVCCVCVCACLCLCMRVRCGVFVFVRLCMCACVHLTHLRKRSYKWPEATEKTLSTSSFFSASLGREEPPVMLNRTRCRRVTQDRRLTDTSLPVSRRQGRVKPGANTQRTTSCHTKRPLDPATTNNTHHALMCRLRRSDNGRLFRQTALQTTWPRWSPC